MSEKRAFEKGALNGHMFMAGVWLTAEMGAKGNWWWFLFAAFLLCFSSIEYWRRT